MRVMSVVAVLGLVVSGTVGGGDVRPAAPEGRASAAEIDVRQDWVWPVPDPPRVVEEYRAPPHPYAAGHRGIDIAATGAVRSPADGRIAFAGTVVDRPLVTIEHGDGLVTTLEPVSTELSAGDAVTRGEEIGTIATGGHAPAGAVHFGVRLEGEYVNPLLLLGGMPRAVLLPCCW